MAITPRRRRCKSTGRADRKVSTGNTMHRSISIRNATWLIWDEAERQAEQETHNERMYQAMLDKVQEPDDEYNDTGVLLGDIQEPRPVDLYRVAPTRYRT